MLKMVSFMLCILYHSYTNIFLSWTETLCLLQMLTYIHSGTVEFLRMKQSRVPNL